MFEEKQCSYLFLLYPNHSAWPIDSSNFVWEPVEQERLFCSPSDNKSGCSKPSNTILALAFFEASLVKVVLSGFSRSSCWASCRDSAGVCFQVSTHRHLMSLPLERASCSSSAFSQRRTAWFCRKELTSFNLARLNSSRCSGRSFSKRTSQSLSFVLSINWGDQQTSALDVTMKHRFQLPKHRARQSCLGGACQRNHLAKLLNQHPCEASYSRAQWWRHHPKVHGES